MGLEPTSSYFLGHPVYYMCHSVQQVFIVLNGTHTWYTLFHGKVHPNNFSQSVLQVSRLQQRLQDCLEYFDKNSQPILRKPLNQQSFLF